MHIASFSNAPAFKAEFSNDYYTNVITSRAMDEDPVALYTLHKILKETGTEDTFTLSKEGYHTHNGAPFKLKNEKTKFAVSEYSVRELLLYAITIAQSKASETKKSLFNTDKDFSDIYSRTYDEVEKATAAKHTEIRNEIDSVSDNIVALDNQIHDLKEERASLEIKKTSLQRSLTRVEKDYITEQIYK